MGLLFVAAIIADIVWPEGKAVTAKKILHISVLIILIAGWFMGWGEGLRTMFAETPWLGVLQSLGILLGLIVWVLGLWLLTVPDHPIQLIVDRFRRKAKKTEEPESPEDEAAEAETPKKSA